MERRPTWNPFSDPANAQYLWKLYNARLDRLEAQLGYRADVFNTERQRLDVRNLPSSDSFKTQLDDLRNELRRMQTQFNNVVERTGGTQKRRGRRSGTRRRSQAKKRKK